MRRKHSISVLYFVLNQQGSGVKSRDGGDFGPQLVQFATVGEAGLLVVGLPGEPCDLAAHVSAQLGDSALVGVVDADESDRLLGRRLVQHLPEELGHFDFGCAGACGVERQVQRLFLAGGVGQRGHAVRAHVHHHFLALAHNVTAK